MGLLAALGTRPWTRAPLLLRRQPAVLLAVAGAAAVLATAAAAPPLFASTVGTAALQRQLASRCGDDVAPYARESSPLAAGVAPVDGDSPAVSGATLIREYARDDTVAQLALGDVPLASGLVMRTLLAPGQGAVDAGGSPAGAAAVAAEVALVVRPGGPESVTLLQDAGGSGVLVPDAVARPTGVSAGGRLFLQLEGRRADVRVRGIYRDLTPVWCQLRGAGYLQAGLGNGQPPGLVITDETTLRSLDARLLFGSVSTYDDQPVGLADLDLAHAQTVVAGLAPAQGQLGSRDLRLEGSCPTSYSSRSPSAPRSPAPPDRCPWPGRWWPCCSSPAPVPSGWSGAGRRCCCWPAAGWARSRWA